jgi:hypothetical protein
MKKNSNNHFKSKVATEAIKGKKTIAQIVSEYEIRPNRVIQWKEKSSGKSSRGLYKKKRHQDIAHEIPNKKICLGLDEQNRVIYYVEVFTLSRIQEVLPKIATVHRVQFAFIRVGSII